MRIVNSTESVVFGNMEGPNRISNYHDGDTFIQTGSGDDYILNRADGSSTLAGGEGDDVYRSFGDSDDLIIDLHGNNFIYMGDGEDTVYLSNITEGHNDVWDFTFGEDAFVFARDIGSGRMETAEDFLAAMAEIDGPDEPGEYEYRDSLGDSYTIEGNNLTFELSDGGSTTFYGIVDDLGL